jgi:hypothetical protein
MPWFGVLLLGTILLMFVVFMSALVWVEVYTARVRDKSASKVDTREPANEEGKAVRRAA